MIDFAESPENQEFRARAREFFAQYVTEEMKAEVRRTGTTHSASLAAALARTGWLAASWPKEYGGRNADPLQLMILAEEATLAEAPWGSITTTAKVSRVLTQLGSEFQRREIVPRALAGEVLICLGYTEPESGSDIAAARTSARRDGDDWIISGQKVFTSLADVSTHVFLLTRTDPAAEKHRGLTLFLVPLDAPGVEILPLYSFDGHRTNITHYDGVKVSDEMRVGEVNGAWRVLRLALALEREAACPHGEFGRLYDTTLSWARTSRGDDGRAVWADPAVRERLARIAIDVEVARLLDYRTAWKAKRGEAPIVEGSMAKLFSTERYVTAAQRVLDMHGPAGAAGLDSGEPAAVEAQQAFGRSVVTTIYGGTSEIQRSIIAEQFLGLPNTRSKS
jgi:alkylation response protein AidB-like acyl-CoA dehydrogenase